MNNGKTVQLSETMVHIMPENLPEAVKLLLDSGADANFKSDNYTPLMLAAGNIHRDNDDIVEMLLEKGARIDEKNWEGWTALMLAVRNGNKNCVKILLDNRASIDLQKKDGYTALMVAIVNKNYYLIKLLLDSNADTSIRSGDWTALDIALMKKNSVTSVIQLLIACGATVFSQDESDAICT